MEIVVIGGGAAGMKAAARARRRDPEAKITVVEASNFVSLGRCGLPYYVGGIVHELDDLRKTTYGAIRNEDYFRRLKNVEVLVNTRATEIDRKKRVVKISRNGSEDELNYDYLVIATGARPVRPPIEGIDHERVVGLYAPEDAERIIELWEEGAERAVVIGAGFIGLETCEALRNLDMEVSLVEALDRVAPAVLDREMALLVEAHLREKGIRVMTNTRVKRISGEETLAVDCGNEKLEADLVVVATGVRPNVELAERAGLKIGKCGGIEVNDRMQTSDERIYAGGDCVEVVNIITGEKCLAPFGDVANKQGRVIGDNITGGNSRFPGVIGTAIAKVFDFSVAVTGLNEESAAKYFDAASVLVPSPDRSHYYPATSYIRVKLVFDRRTRRVIGAQIVGAGIVDKRIDVIATAIMAKMTVDDLADLDLAYAPPYSAALDNVITAANVAKNKLDGMFESINVFELRRKIESGEDFVILDVRSEEEIRQKKIDASNVMYIPLLELREKINEVPKDKEIVVVCQLGLRAYEAYRILRGYGFENVKILEGGMAFWV